MKEQIKQLVERIRPILASYWLKFAQSKFYTNKKIFLPVTIAAGLMVLTILIGLIFGGRRSVQSPKNLPSPSPSFTGGATTATPGIDALSQIEQKLTNDKNQIGSLDVKESRLAPPTLDFNIKF